MQPISLKKKLLGGGAWAFAGKVLTALTGLVSNALLARLLTPDEMGVYFLTLSFVFLTATVAQFGLPQAVVRLVAESMATDRYARARLLVRKTIFLAAAGIFCVAFILVIGGGQWVAEHLFHSVLMEKTIDIAVLWMAMLVCQQLMAEIYRGFHDIRLATVFGGMATGLLAILLFYGLWLVQGKSDLRQIVQLAVLAVTLNVLITGGFLRLKMNGLPMPAGNEIGMPYILNLAWPLGITGLTLLALNQGDIWVMGAFQSADEVAIYGAAYRVVYLVSMPLLIVNAVLPPLISEMYAQQKIVKLQAIIRGTAAVAGVPAFLLIVLLFFYGDFFLSLFYGEFYRAGGIILSILSIGQLVNVWAGSCGLVLMLTGHQMTMMSITIFTGLLTIGGAWWLVTFYGGVGVASAAAGGMILQNMLMLFYAKKKVGVWTHMQLTAIPKLGGIIS